MKKSEAENSNKLIVISFDALVREDLEYLREKPSFRWIMEEGARVERVRSVYPTLTYVCHTVMATGCFPDKTGVINNEMLIPGLNTLPWLWYHENVKCEDILTACKRTGKTTAAIGWPVTGKHPDVDWLVDEIWPFGEDYSAENWKNAYLRSGTPEKLFCEAVEPYLPLRMKKAQPDSSYFLTKVSCAIIRRYQPDILLLHVGNIDSYRHSGGVFCDRVRTGLDECEQMLTEIIDAVKDAGVFEQTNLVVTADHGQIDVARTVHPNVLLKKNGLIRTDSDGNLDGWDAWCASAGTSAQVFLKDPGNRKLYDRLFSLLLKWKDEGIWGFSEVFTEEETERTEHYGGGFSFVLETDGYSMFGNNYTGKYAETAPESICGVRKGYHGHHPDKGPSPMFIGCGPAFRKGAVLERANLTDGAPTYAKIMGADLPNADGRALDELLVAVK